MDEQNKKAKSSSKSKSAQRSTKAPTQPTQSDKLKTVVRRLPPNLPEEIFWQSVQQWVSEDTVTWRAYYPGKLSKKFYKENVPSRAYIAFKSDEQLASFSQAYDGHLFRDKAGNESQAVVEFAPCQKIPPEKKKVDPRNGTIEQDEDYISFIRSLTAPPSKPAETETLEALIAASQPPPQPKSTPLLDALRAEKSAAKDKEAILRNHAHYHAGPSVVVSKEDAKKRGGKASEEPQAAGGKKSSRGKKAEAKAAAQAGASGSGSGNAAKVAPAPTTSPQKPVPKHSRTSKPQKPVEPTKPTTAPAVPAQPNAPPVNTTTTAGTSVEGQPTVPTAPRKRPVIGLATRQFEAALSGAGVAVAGGERRARRERGPKADGAPPESASAGASAGASAEPVNNAGGIGRGRGPEGKGGRGPRRRGDSASAAQGDKIAGPAPPTILARPDGPVGIPAILARPPEVPSAPVDKLAVPPAALAGGPPEGVGRGGGGGRGRGSGGGLRKDGEDGAGRGDGRGKRRGRGRQATTEVPG